MTCVASKDTDLHGHSAWACVPVWSQSSLFSCRKFLPLATHKAHIEDWSASAWQNQQNDLSAQGRLRSAWASAQSEQSSLRSQWVAKDLSFIPADSEVSDQTNEDPDQTGRMPRLIRVFAGCTSFLLVLSCTGSNDLCGQQRHRSAWAFSLGMRPSLITVFAVLL